MAGATDEPARLTERWITDTETTARFPLYTRGNADEVGPEPFSPLGWDLGWAAGAAPGTVWAYIHIGAAREAEFRWPVPESYGCWGGYFFNQVSLGRVMGVRMPGGSPDAIDRAYFGSNPDIPPYEAHPQDEDPELTLALGRTAERVLAAESWPAMDAFLAKVGAWRAGRPDLAALDDAALVSWAREASSRLVETWDVYAQVVIGASFGPGAVQVVCAGVGRPDLAPRLFAGLGGVRTADTSRAVWRLSRLVHASEVLTKAFDQGVAGLTERLDGLTADADVKEFAAALEELLAEHGHRGPNEWDLMSECWASSPDLALGMVERIRLQRGDLDPQGRTAGVVADREAALAEVLDLLAGDQVAVDTLRAGLRSGTLFYQLREAGKDAAVRVMVEAKLPLFELGRRHVARGHLRHHRQLFMLLDAELEDFLAAPQTFSAVLEEREAQLAELGRREPPYTVLHGRPMPPVSSWPLRQSAGAAADAGARAAIGTVLTGIGVSPGTATGPARVVRSLADAGSVEPGDILVCGSTDPSWVPLFLSVGAVVCDIGALGSHAAIVSRELGVPCVVSVHGATTTIADGAMLSVDGARGTVELLAADAGQPGPA